MKEKTDVKVNAGGTEKEKKRGKQRIVREEVKPVSREEYERRYADACVKADVVPVRDAEVEVKGTAAE